MVGINIFQRFKGYAAVFLWDRTGDTVRDDKESLFTNEFSDTARPATCRRLS